jgi:hypothetical protein
MGKKRKACRVWLENLKERNCLDNLAAKEEDNIKMDLKSIVWFELMWFRIAMSGGVF